MDIIPTIGMGATEYIGSDAYPYEVVEIVKAVKGIPTIIRVRKMDYKADPNKPGGMGHQNWLITSNPNNSVFTLKYKNYKYKKGWYLGSSKFYVGHASYHYDWSF